MKSWTWLGSNQHVRAKGRFVANPLLNPKSTLRLEECIEGRSIGIITATLSALNPPVNKNRDMALRSEATEAGLAYVRSYAVRTGNDHCVERSLIAFQDKGYDSGLLEAALLRLAKRHGQAAVIYKPFDSKNAFIYEPDAFGEPAKLGNAIDIGRWGIDRLPEFHSMVVNGKMASLPAYFIFKMLGEWTSSNRGRPGTEGPEFL